MKIIDILAAQKDCAENFSYSTETLSKPFLEDINCDSAKNWSADESDSDEDDELNLSFREGTKRSASDEFCHDLKRIKFDNNVRDLTSNFSFQLDFVIKVDESKGEKTSNHASELETKSQQQILNTNENNYVNVINRPPTYTAAPDIHK